MDNIFASVAQRFYQCTTYEKIFCYQGFVVMQAPLYHAPPVALSTNYLSLDAILVVCLLRSTARYALACPLVTFRRLSSSKFAMVRNEVVCSFVSYQALNLA